MTMWHDTCRCGELMLDGRPTGSRNWNPDCPEHGTASEWYRSPEQVAKREADSARLRDLYRRAREARAGRGPGF
jgi:hypothetical protein